MKILGMIKKLSYFKKEQKYSQTYFENDFIKILRGEISEIIGESSNGKTSLLLALISSLTNKGEVCSLVDVNNSFNPGSFANKGELGNLLWIRCDQNVENALRTVDCLIQAKNFGLVWLNLSESDETNLNRIPTAYWYRFRNKIRNSQTILVITAKQSVSGSAATERFEIKNQYVVWSGFGRFRLLKEFRIRVTTKKQNVMNFNLVKIKARRY